MFTVFGGVTTNGDVPKLGSALTGEPNFCEKDKSGCARYDPDFDGVLKVWTTCDP